MAELAMTLLSHTGHESTASTPRQNQEFGNPLRLRPALDGGVSVVMQHSGRAGSSLSDPADASSPPGDNFELFVEMMGRPQYPGRLFGKVAALPVPASQPLLFRIISPDEEASLQEIYDCNPLLGSFVTARTLRSPASRRTIPESVFVSLETLTARCTP